MTQIRFQDSARDRRPGSSNDWKNGLGVPYDGLHTVDTMHGSITVEGPPVEAPALRRYSLGGLGPMVTTFEPVGDDLVIAAVAPAGDVDADGREDLLVRGATGLGPDGVEEVVLLYGYSGTRGRIDPFEDGIRKTRIRIPATHLNRPDGLSGGGDLDGDGLADPGLVLTDAVYLLGFLFLGGPSPVSPFPEPGADGTPDALGCLR